MFRTQTLKDYILNVFQQRWRVILYFFFFYKSLGTYLIHKLKHWGIVSNISIRFQSPALLYKLKNKILYFPRCFVNTPLENLAFFSYYFSHTNFVDNMN